MNVSNKPCGSFTSTDSRTLQRNAPIPGFSATLGRENDGFALDPDPDLAFKSGSSVQFTSECYNGFESAFDRSSVQDRSGLSMRHDSVMFGVSKDSSTLQRNSATPGSSANLSAQSAPEHDDLLAPTPVQSYSWNESELLIHPDSAGTCLLVPKKQGNKAFMSSEEIYENVCKNLKGLLEKLTRLQSNEDNPSVFEALLKNTPNMNSFLFLKADLHHVDVTTELVTSLCFSFGSEDYLASPKQLYRQCWKLFLQMCKENSYWNIAIFHYHVFLINYLYSVKPEYSYHHFFKIWPNEVKGRAHLERMMVHLIALEDFVRKTLNTVKSSESFRNALRSIITRGFVDAGMEVGQMIGRDLYSMTPEELELVFKGCIPSSKWYAKELLSDTMGMRIDDYDFQIELQNLLISDDPVCNLQNVGLELVSLYSGDELYKECWKNFFLMQEENSYEKIVMFCCYADFVDSFRRVKPGYFYQEPMCKWPNNTKGVSTREEVMEHLIALKDCIKKTFSQKVSLRQLESNVSAIEEKERVLLKVSEVVRTKGYAYINALQSMVSKMVVRTGCEAYELQDWSSIPEEKLELAFKESIPSLKYYAKKLSRELFKSTDNQRDKPKKRSAGPGVRVFVTKTLSNDEIKIREIILYALVNVCDENVDSDLFTFQKKKLVDIIRIFKELESNPRYTIHSRLPKIHLAAMIEAAKSIHDEFYNILRLNQFSSKSFAGVDLKGIKKEEYQLQMDLDKIKLFLKNFNKFRSMVYDFPVILASPEAKKEDKFCSGLKCFFETITASFKSGLLSYKGRWHYTIGDYYNASIEAITEIFSSVEISILELQHGIEKAEKMENTELRQEEIARFIAKFYNMPLDSMPLLDSSEYRSILQSKMREHRNRGKIENGEASAQIR